MAQNYYNNAGPVIHAGTIIGDVSTTTIVTVLPPPPEPDPIFFNVRCAEINFVGRSSELYTLEDVMQISPNSSLSQPHIMVISGLGGVGKTQLVRRFVEKNRSNYKNVIWINAEKKEVINESFKTLAEDRLTISTNHPDGKEKDINSVIEEVFTKLSKRKTLCVYDNVDNVENVRLLLTIATSGEKPHIIVTSRIQEWGDDISLILLKTWELDDAVKYVSITLKDPKDSEDDKKLLVETLQAFPLALRQATALINYQRQVGIFHITNYVAEYDTYDKLNSTFFQKAVSNLYEKTTFTTWKITIDAIERDPVNGKLAVRILNIIAYFDPENIYTDIFDHCRYDQEETKGNIKSAVNLLVNYSMVDSQDEVRTVLSVHRLVQKVVQLNLQKANQKKPILRDALQLMSELIQTKQVIVKVTIPHAMAVFLSALDIHELIKEFSILPTQILSNSIKHTRYNIAKAFSDKIQQPMVNILGESHKAVLAIKYNIGDLYIRQGLYAEAIEIATDVYKKVSISIGEYHMDTLLARIYIAFSNRELGHFSKALEIFEDVYNKHKNFAGDEHPDTLKIKTNLAFSYRQVGKHTKALQMYEEVYNKQKIIVGEDHPDTLITRSYTAFCYRQLEKHSEALQMYEEVYKKQKFILGEDHSDTLNTRSNVATSYIKLGKDSEALQMYEDVYNKQKMILGEDHPRTLISKSDIASAYRNLDKFSEALQIYEEVYNKQKINVREDDTNTLATRSDIAFCYIELGKHSEGLQIYKDVYNKEKMILGEDHPRTLITRSNVATSYKKLGKQSEALQIYEEVYNKQKIVLGEDHPHTRMTKRKLSDSECQCRKCRRRKNML